MRFISFTLFTSLMVSASVLTQQKPPVFRSKIDLMQLDVTVLDKKGVPVRGLTQADFTVVEDDKPQSIQAFTAVDVPERTVTGPVWEKKVSPDVTSNEIDNARIFVLVLDDALGVGCCTELNQEITRPGMPPPPPARQFVDPLAVRELKKTTELFIDTLGPNDLAAVVFTGATYKSNQGLTQDRSKLLKAVQAYPLNDGTLFLDPGIQPKEVKPIPQCLAAKQIVMMIDSVVTNLATVPDRRKAIVYFGGSMPWGQPKGWCDTYWMWQDVFARAQQAHVTINPVQTSGLTGFKPGPGNSRAPVPAWTDQYLAVADNTGGHAVVNTNDFAPGMRQIFLENSSYYLMAYQPARDVNDGTFRRIKVKVNRPDLEVRTRRSYWAPRETPADRPAPEPPPPQVEAMAGILPKSELNLRATAAPFALPGAPGGAITLAIGVRQPAFGTRTSEQVDLLVKAYMADGDAKATDAQTIPITVPAAKDSDVSRYEVLARVELPKPGRYELRLTAHSAVNDTRGSVYVDVEVPDFKKEKVSLSGVVLNNALAATPVAPLRVLRDIVSIVPTTERAFAATDIVTAFLRVYQGGNDKLAAIPLKIQIQDAKGQKVFDRTDTLTPEQFTADRAADFQYRLPLSTLSAGEYLLTLEAAVGKNTARRDVRFEKR